MNYPQISQTALLQQREQRQGHSKPSAPWAPSSPRPVADIGTTRESSPQRRNQPSCPPSRIAECGRFRSCDRLAEGHRQLTLSPGMHIRLPSSRWLHQLRPLYGSRNCGRYPLKNGRVTSASLPCSGYKPGLQTWVCGVIEPGLAST